MSPDQLKRTDRKFKTWQRVLICIFYIVWVNVCSGFIATQFNYPSLFNVQATFSEYALPLPFTWALAHLPGMLVFSVLLFLIDVWQEKTIKIFRAVCIAGFILLFLEAGAKNPFVLFAKVDLMSAFLFSLLLVPPSRKQNPVLVRLIKIGTGAIVLFLGAVGVSLWQHRVPSLAQVDYLDGAFQLQSIEVQADYRRTFTFNVSVNAEMAEHEICEAGQLLASELLNDYPFDDSYNKVIVLFGDVLAPFGTYPGNENGGDSSENRSRQEIGEISLNEEHREADNRFPCFVKRRL